MLDYKKTLDKKTIACSTSFRTSKAINEILSEEAKKQNKSVNLILNELVKKSFQLN